MASCGRGQYHSGICCNAMTIILLLVSCCCRPTAPEVRTPCCQAPKTTPKSVSALTLSRLRAPGSSLTLSWLCAAHRIKLLISANGM
jgi:hypothetical protein